jgi:NAD(P)-dependent dehydrogenase (short-subunit alcohol dehydrogenase family)
MSEKARTVLVAGGTRGIGRAIGLAFGRAGARVVLTHRWGSADPVELCAAFESAGAPAPQVEEADVSDPEDTRSLMERIGSCVDVFVSNVCVVGRGTGTLSERDLRRSLEYSAWPLLRYLEAMESAFGTPPRYVVATSSDGPDRFYPGYDYVAASKSVLEALCARLAGRHPRMRLNALRARQVDTAGYREMFGAEARDMVGRFARFDVQPEEVARVAVALCSGDLDGLSGQVVTVDRGAGPLDNLVNVAPTLLGSASVAPVVAAAGSESAVHRAQGVLWVDAGVTPGDVDLCRPVDVVAARDAGAVDPARIPDCVVVGCDWTVRAEEDWDAATLLPELMDRAAGSGDTPRYGVRVDRGVDPPAPGEALARTLDRYWGSWRAGTESRLNAVRFTADHHHAQAVSAVRALLSGAMDGVRGQLLHVARGPVS